MLANLGSRTAWVLAPTVPGYDLDLPPGSCSFHFGKFWVSDRLGLRPHAIAAVALSVFGLRPPQCTSGLRSAPALLRYDFGLHSAKKTRWLLQCCVLIAGFLILLFFLWIFFLGACFVGVARGKSIHADCRQRRTNRRTDRQTADSRQTDRPDQTRQTDRPDRQTDRDRQTRDRLRDRQGSQTFPAFSILQCGKKFWYFLKK